MENTDQNQHKCYSEIEKALRWGQYGMVPMELEVIADDCGIDYETAEQVLYRVVEDMEEKKNDLDYAVRHAIGKLREEGSSTDDDFYIFKWFWNRDNYAQDFESLPESELEAAWIRNGGDGSSGMSNLSESADKALSNKAKASGISKSILKSVYSKGAAAWKSGHRPGVSQQQWAMGRVNSFITGKGGARKADADLWARAKKSKKRKNESLEVAELRKLVRSVISEINDMERLASREEANGPDITALLPYAELVSALGKDMGWDHDLTQQVSYALEIKDAKERERRIVELLKDYDVYDEYFHLLRMNEGDGMDEMYPLMVGEDTMEEGAGKYLAGAALAASLAGAPMKSSAQTPFRDMAKQKISMVKDKITKAFGKPDDTAETENTKDVATQMAELDAKVGKLEEISPGNYRMTSKVTSPDLSMASRMARIGAETLIMEKLSVEVSPGKYVIKGRLGNAVVEDESMFLNRSGIYTCYVTITCTVTK